MVSCFNLMLSAQPRSNFKGKALGTRLPSASYFWRHACPSAIPQVNVTISNEKFSKGRFESTLPIL